MTLIKLLKTRISCIRRKEGYQGSRKFEGPLLASGCLDSPSVLSPRSSESLGQWDVLGFQDTRETSLGSGERADHRDEDHPDLHLHNWLPAYPRGVFADLGDSQAIPVMSGLCVTSVMPTNGEDSGVEALPPSL